MSHVSKIKCFKCGKPGHIATNYFSKKNCMSKHAMKIEVIILGSRSIVDEDDTNILAFMASRLVEDLPNAPSQGHKVFIDENVDQDELLGKNNEHLREHKKMEKAMKKLLESFEERE